MSLIDIRKLYIDQFSLILGLLYGLIILPIETYHNRIFFVNSLVNSIGTVFMVFFILITMSIVVQKIVGYQVLGHGDSKLAAMGSAWIGFKGIAIALAIAFFLSGVFTFVKLLFGKFELRKPIPFAPYLSLGILIIWTLGTEFVVMLWNNL